MNFDLSSEMPAPPPSPIEDAGRATQVVISDGTLGYVVTTANLLVTAIIIVGMLIDGQQAGRAIVIGAAYFATTTPLYLLVLTGALSAIVNAWQREKTERLRIQAYERVMVVGFQWRVMVEENRTAEIQVQAMPLQLTQRIAALEAELLDRQLAPAMPNPGTFVTPYDNRSEAAFAAEVQAPVDTTATEAVGWLRTLYDDLGQPDPKKVQLVGDPADHGRLRIRMLGSKRGGGSGEAGLWLIKRGVIARARGGYQLNLKLYPTRNSIRTLL